MFFSSSFLGFNPVHNVPMPSEAAVFLPIEAGSDDVWKLGGGGVMDNDEDVPGSPYSKELAGYAIPHYSNSMTFIDQ